MIAQRGDGDPVRPRGLQDGCAVGNFELLVVEDEFDHVTLQHF
jgi:hypothetical protein